MPRTCPSVPLGTFRHVCSCETITAIKENDFPRKFPRVPYLPSHHCSPRFHSQAIILLSVTVEEFAFSSIFCKHNHIVHTLFFLSAFFHSAYFERAPKSAQQTSHVSVCFQANASLLSWGFCGPPALAVPDPSS